MHHSPGSEPVQIDILDQKGGSEWDRLVVSYPDYTFFHCAAWAQVICKTYGHTPIYFRFSPPSAGFPILVPLIEVSSPLTGRRAVCLPFSDTCGPLVFSQNGSSFLKESLSRLARQRNWNYFEIRGGEPLEQSAQPAMVFYGHRLDLRKGTETLWEAFRASTAQAVRQALRNKLNVEILDTSQAVREFYQLHVRTRRRHGLPPQPAKFFVNICQTIIKPGLGFVILVREGVRTIAGAIFFRFHKHAVYKFAASDPEFARKRGNNLVLWEAIKFLSRRGAEFLDMGRTSLTNEGLRRFKLSWGAQEWMLPYYRFDTGTAAWTQRREHATGLHNCLFRHLPLALNRMAGALLYPHLD